MDSILMIQWFKSVILPHTKGKPTLLVIDSSSTHEDIDFLNLAHSHCVNVVIIPGSMSKTQPLDVSVSRQKWMEYIDSIVDTTENPSPQDKLKPPDKPKLVQWIKSGLNYLQEKHETVMRSFLVSGITNALDGFQNHFVCCAKQPAGLELPYHNRTNYLNSQI